MGFLLNLIDFLLFPILSIINVVVVVWKNPNWKTFTGYFMQSAIDIDVFGNHNLRTLLNTLCRKANGYKFGAEGETISSALGKNQRDKTLSSVGSFVVAVLNFLEKDHCKKSINNNII